MDIKNETEFYRWLGAEFRALREQAGLKQKDVAAKAGIPAAELSRFERNGMKLSAFRVALLFKTVGIDFSDFVTDIGKKKLTFTLNGNSLGELSNGEKKDLLEKIKFFIKIFFSKEIMMEVAKELQEEYDQSRRDAALKKAQKDQKKQNGEDFSPA